MTTINGFNIHKKVFFTEDTEEGKYYSQSTLKSMEKAIENLKKIEYSACETVQSDFRVPFTKDFGDEHWKSCMLQNHSIEFFKFNNPKLKEVPSHRSYDAFKSSLQNLEEFSEDLISFTPIKSFEGYGEIKKEFWNSYKKCIISPSDNNENSYFKNVIKLNNIIKKYCKSFCKSCKSNNLGFTEELNHILDAKHAIIYYLHFYKNNKYLLGNRTLNKVYYNVHSLSNLILEVLPINHPEIDKYKKISNKFSQLGGYSEYLPCIEDAIAIPQNGAAITYNRKKVGTRNIHDCVFFLVHDKTSGITVAAHVDKYTSLGSLKKLFIDTIPEKNDLKAFVIGARTTYINPSRLYNINKISQIINQYPDIDVSWDCANKQIPSAVVVDTKNLTVHKAYPKLTFKNYRSYWAREGLVYLNNNPTQPLTPIHVEKHPNGKVETPSVRLEKKQYYQLYSTLKENFDIDKNKVTELSERIFGSQYAHCSYLCKAFQAKWLGLRKQLIQKHPKIDIEKVSTAMQKVMELNEDVPFEILSPDTDNSIWFNKVNEFLEKIAD